MSCLFKNHDLATFTLSNPIWIFQRLAGKLTCYKVVYYRLTFILNALKFT